MREKRLLALDLDKTEIEFWLYDLKFHNILYVTWCLCVFSFILCKNRNTDNPEIRQHECDYLACNRCSINCTFVPFPCLHNQGLGVRQLHFPKPFAAWATWVTSTIPMCQPNKLLPTGWRFQLCGTIIVIDSLHFWLFFILRLPLPMMVSGWQ